MGERHCYVLQSPVNAASGSAQSLWNDKQFHVSPFMEMNMRYRWRLTEPGDRLAIHIVNQVISKQDPGITQKSLPETRQARSTRQPFQVTLSMNREQLTAASLRRVLLRHPCMTARVTAGIYWQAFRLWRGKESRLLRIRPNKHQRNEWLKLEETGQKQQFAGSFEAVGDGFRTSIFTSDKVTAHFSQT